VTVTLVPRTRADAFRLNNLQVQLFAAALLAVGAPDRDLLAPRGYVPSQVCTAWSDQLFPALSDLVLVELWDVRRAQLRPRAVLRAPVSLERGQRRRVPPAPDPWASLPLLHERTGVMETALGPLLLSLASWLGTCGGCTVDPG
jgi:hypothetical protein